MRWANDKYKGILAFRANLRNRPAHEERHEFISRCRSAEFPSAIFCHSADLETLSAIKLHDSNSWQATSHVAREENRDRLLGATKIIVCTTLAAIAMPLLDESARDVL